MADYYKNDDDKIVNTEPTPLNPSPKVVVVENAETGELAPSPKLEADVLVEGEQNKDAKIVGQSPIKFPIPPVREMTYTDLVNVIKENAPEMSAEEITAMLTGKYVRIMDAPTSTTLTDKQKAQIIEGCFIKGTILGRVNPVFFPAKQSGSDYKGLIIGRDTGTSSFIQEYTINDSNTISLNASKYIQFADNNLYVQLYYLNNKEWPANPTDLTKDYVLQQVKLSGSLAWNSLDGKYVRIMDAPTSTTLTDDQIAQIKEGTFINGDFLGYHNLMLFPAVQLYNFDNIFRGAYIGRKTTSGNEYLTFIGMYNIDTETKTISNLGTMLSFNERGFINFAINGKEFPSNPGNTGTFTLKFVDGTLTWVAD